jgi:hypothetical protein
VAFSEADLGQIEILWLNGESGSRRERFGARDWRQRERERIPAGVGILFRREDRGRKRSPARRDKLSRRVRLKVVPP